MPPPQELSLISPQKKETFCVPNPYIPEVSAHLGEEWEWWSYFVYYISDYRISPLPCSGIGFRMYRALSL